ncbi:electron transfer flavoprotein subunit alpha/FixB family protein [Legionella oakridgensis]|uniref:Electron transfer flavoprotein subunit alpha n=2 Tax=Legionella oakridgensis TaxID=29423 RepID=W0B826_9GAMM|nr:FAD-binding protein [Legionella oakridgensis]AHE66703.1 electron transfer flavoprotein, alpha subunit [Legionella oakridgensis ATCC 33761 = DSM 21215]ETO93574.1 electron transfer flavoprotein alpha, subunit apoprotein [Legionella oakridgensis RV-2-2007]KTD38080.1 electron transfer flavoprotein, alpha subunit [Legionella oakridgensis]STY19839.1 electron transfer flavoprotein, alpha subuni [Legionella longbeachae]
MSALILVEHDNKTIHSSIRHVLAAALQFTEKPVLLVIGHHCQAVAEQAAILKGVSEVWHVDNACYEHPLAENIATLMAELSSSFTYLLSASTTFGKNILPRVAALLDVVQISDVTRIVHPDTFEHPIYAGNAIETVKVLDEKKVLTIRTTAFDAVMEEQAACGIERIEKVYQPMNSMFVRHELSQSFRPDLSGAKIIVSGGRGLQSAEKFKLIEELADVLGAAVGASRAAVDAGFVSNDYQVGQTGKVVAPMLYIAVGISGAVQHMAGMKDSKVIVAINKDEDAPIFQIADYGLVGDLFEVVPQLIEQLK